MTIGERGEGHIHPGGEAFVSPQPLEGQIDESIDTDLGSLLSQGPSSLIDEQVAGALNRLKQRENRPTVLQMIANPVATFSLLKSYWQETDAYANARSTVAKAVQTQAKWAGEDIQRDVVLSYMSSLRKNLGDLLPNFRTQNGLPAVPENSIAEMTQLLRLNLSIVAVTEYHQALERQVNQVIAERTRQEGMLARSRSRAQILPALIESQAVSQPLQRQVIFQNVAHSAGILGGSVGAAAGGLVAGTFEGLGVGFVAARNWGREKMAQIKQRVRQSTSPRER